MENSDVYKNTFYLSKIKMDNTFLRFRQISLNLQKEIRGWETRQATNIHLLFFLIQNSKNAVVVSICLNK